MSLSAAAFVIKDAVCLQAGGIAASLDRDGIRTRLPVGQQCALMGEYGLRTAKVQQVHGVRPCVRRNINAVRGLLHAARFAQPPHGQHRKPHRAYQKSQQPEKPATGVISGGAGGIRTHVRLLAN